MATSSSRTRHRADEVQEPPRGARLVPDAPSGLVGDGDRAQVETARPGSRQSRNNAPAASAESGRGIYAGWACRPPQGGRLTCPSRRPPRVPAGPLHLCTGGPQKSPATRGSEAGAKWHLGRVHRDASEPAATIMNAAHRPIFRELQARLVAQSQRPGQLAGPSCRAKYDQRASIISYLPVFFFAWAPPSKTDECVLWRALQRNSCVASSAPSTFEHRWGTSGTFERGKAGWQADFFLRPRPSRSRFRLSIPQPPAQTIAD